MSSFSASLEKQASSSVQKDSFPLRYGTYSKIQPHGFEFLFNLNGEIKFSRGLLTAWSYPAEQLERIDGSDWAELFGR